MGFPSTFDDALLFVLSVLFREIFIWQLLRLVLTYNFTDCDFEKIKMDYRGVILIDLNSYMIGAQSTKGNDWLFCDDQFRAIESLSRLSGIPEEATLYPTPSEGRQIRNWDHGMTSVAHTPHSGGAVPKRAAPPLSSRPGPESWAERAAVRVLSPAASSAPLATPLLPVPPINSLFSFCSPPPPPPFFPFLVKFAACEQPDCLTKIEHLTFHPTHGCQSLAEEIFAMNTNATLTHRCPGYSGIQINNNTSAMEKGKEREDIKNECQKIVSKLIGLWRRFTRFNRNKNLH
ncbi:thymic stromal lymphopoietin [Rhinolophus ferrumequinum]|uniref:thymic stromal lymphopoietin n=1 Tax=Rhinolophus ferrumequinum TaxID=59479 RepID=UPI00140F77EA|nr:thymic stromal lymphopoietin [Rhinolophus ferrumequinum]